MNRPTPRRLVPAAAAAATALLLAACGGGDDANRVYVMAPAPGHVAEIVDVPFGPDRGPLVKRDPPLPRPARRAR